jgi:hypothetical protein
MAAHQPGYTGNNDPDLRNHPDHGEKKTLRRFLAMQEKKNKRLFILLLALIAVTVSFVWFGNKEQTLNVNKDLFKVEGLETVDRVLLESDSGKIALTFNGTRWRVNDHYDADRNMITVLMATLREAEPRRPVAASLADSLSQLLEKKGTHVSLFRGQDLIRRFYAGGNSSQTQSYFKDPETGSIYLMTIPGYRVYVSGIMELNENGWRDKYIFGFMNGRTFQGLKAEFPSKPSENFTVALINDSYGVENLVKIDTARLYTYLDNVLTLTADEYLKPSVLNDSLLTVKPQLVITVTDIAGRKYTLRLYPPVNNQIPAIFNENQAILFNPQKIRPLVRPKSFFALK